MKVLLTGAFGNLGSDTLEALLAKGEHDVRCFDLKNPRNEKIMKRLSGKGSFEIVWGDITDAGMTDKAIVYLHKPSAFNLQPENLNKHRSLEQCPKYS